MSFQGTLRNARKYANDLEVDDVLELVGLQRRRSSAAYAIPTLGFIAVGVLVGAGLGLIFAPTSGRLLRRQAETKVSGLKQRIRQNANEMRNNIEAKVSSNDVGATPSPTI